MQFAAGSMGPKVKAAARFAAKTGKRAAIGSLADIAGIVAGTAGTNVIMRRRPTGPDPDPRPTGRRRGADGHAPKQPNRHRGKRRKRST